MIENFLLSVLANLLTSHAMFVFVVVLFAYMYCFWCLWVVANIAHTRVHRFVYAILMWASIIIGGLADVFFNWTFAIALFLDRPRESTLSMRLTRYLHEYGPYTYNPGWSSNLGMRLVQKWRLTLTVWLATHLIEPWAQGHIGLVRLGFAPAHDMIGPVLEHNKNAWEQFLIMGMLLISAAGIAATAWGLI